MVKEPNPVGWLVVDRIVRVAGVRTFGSRRGGGPERPDSGFWGGALTTERQSQLIEQSKEHRLPGGP